MFDDLNHTKLLSNYLSKPLPVKCLVYPFVWFAGLQIERPMSWLVQFFFLLLLFI